MRTLLLPTVRHRAERRYAGNVGTSVISEETVDRDVT
jgi:hypothetical protein